MNGHNKAPKMHTQASVDFSDIQGLVRFSHAHLSEAAYLLLNIKDLSVARVWLSNISVNTAEKVDPIPEKAIQLAFSAKGLRSLNISRSLISQFSDEFVAGMADGGNRSRRLGDIGNNSPTHWDWANLENGAPDVLLMLFAQQGQLSALLDKIQSSDFSDAFTIEKTLTSDRSSGKEPFGFEDGISQPQIDWQQTISTDEHERDQYINRMALGEVILGYRNEYGLYTDRPLIDPKQDPQAASLPVAEDEPDFHDLGRHGSYLVLRQLSQDVPKFWQYLDKQVDGNPQQREKLAASMVGRHIDGSPLIESSDKARSGVNQKSQNNFNYDADPHGQKCPIGAHIRRANPRTVDYPSGVNNLFGRLMTEIGFKRRHPNDDLISSTRFHRILRRGRPYGPEIKPEDATKPDAIVAERGLNFICLGANIARQFEFVQNAWMMSTKFAGLTDERDPLLGTRETLLNGQSSDGYTLPMKNTPAKCLKNLPQFVTTRGGAYFFMPGLAALRYLINAHHSENNKVRK